MQMFSFYLNFHVNSHNNGCYWNANIGVCVRGGKSQLTNHTVHVPYAMAGILSPVRGKVIVLETALLLIVVVNCRRC